MELKPYPNYKESNELWLGKVPSNWEVRKVKYLFTERVEKNHPDEPLLAATQIKGVILKEEYENRTVLALKDLYLLKLVKKDDFVISLRSFQGGIEYCHQQGIISPAYTVIIPNDSVSSKYLKHIFKSAPFIDLLKTCVTGIREGQNINYELLRQHFLPVPPKDEQKEIAIYLDTKNEQISKYINLKKHFIQLLEEQKHNIINQTITRGLDPSVKLKPGGVEWLKDLPQDWDIWKLKYLFTIHGRIGFHGLSSDDYEDKGILLVTGTDFKNDQVDRKECHRINELWYDRDINIQLKNGDLLVTKDGSIGKTAIIKNLHEKAVLNSGIFLIRPKDKDIIRNNFLLNIIKSKIFLNFMELNKTGATVQHLYEITIKNFSIPLPTIEEQKEICNFIESKLQPINILIKKIENSISLLAEYKNRIVADLVTGKMSVSDNNAN